MPPTLCLFRRSEPFSHQLHNTVGTFLIEGGPSKSAQQKKSIPKTNNELRIINTSMRVLHIVSFSIGCLGPKTSLPLQSSRGKCEVVLATLFFLPFSTPAVITSITRDQSAGCLNLMRASTRSYIVGSLAVYEIRKFEEEESLL